MDVTYGIDLGVGTTGRRHVRTRDGRESHRSTTTSIFVADDWDTLESWDLEPLVPMNRLPDVENVQPDTIWGQDTIVVLTEQLNDVFVAPSDMDVTDIAAWLDLFGLPDNLSARKQLARTVTSHARGSVFFGKYRSRDWMSRCVWERRTTQYLTRSRLNMMADPGIRCIAGISIPAIATESTLNVDSRSLPRITDSDTARSSWIVVGRQGTAYSPASLIDYGDRTEIGLLYSISLDYGNHVTVQLPSSLYQKAAIRLPDECFTCRPVSRPVPLDVSLMAAAHADGRRHTIPV